MFSTYSVSSCCCRVFVTAEVNSSCLSVISTQVEKSERGTTFIPLSTPTTKVTGTISETDRKREILYFSSPSCINSVPGVQGSSASLPRNIGAFLELLFIAADLLLHSEHSCVPV